MSRAFVKETDSVEELPDRPISEYPNDVTAAGLAQIEITATELQAQYAKAQADGDRDAAGRVAQAMRVFCHDSVFSNGVGVRSSDWIVGCLGRCVHRVHRGQASPPSGSIFGKDQRAPTGLDGTKAVRLDLVVDLHTLDAMRVTEFVYGVGVLSARHYFTLGHVLPPELQRVFAVV